MAWRLVMSAAANNGEMAQYWLRKCVASGVMAIHSCDNAWHGSRRPGQYLSAALGSSSGNHVISPNGWLIGEMCLFGAWRLLGVMRGNGLLSMAAYGGSVMA